MKFVISLDYRVFSDNLSKISLVKGKTVLITTISPNSYGISTKNKEFQKALKKSDFLVLDGVYFALASILLKGKNIKKIRGRMSFIISWTGLIKVMGKLFF